MEFTQLPALSLLSLVPIWFYLRHRHRQRATHYSSLALLPTLTTPRQRLAVWWPASWRTLVLLLIILALAGPRVPDRRSGIRLPTEGIAISLVLDTSSSMATRDFYWRSGESPISRLEAAKRVLRLFIEGGTGPAGNEFAGRPTDLLGLVTFAVWPEAICPLTLSHSVLLNLLETQQPARGLNEGTNVGDAIALGVQQLESAGQRRKVLILLSDGEHNFDLQEPRKPFKPRQAAQLAAARGITIYAVDPGGEPRPAKDPDDSAGQDAYQQRLAGRQTLQSIVNLTGGQMFVANDAASLVEVYKAIDAMEREEILSYRYRRYHDWTPWLGLAALLAFALGLGLERSWLRTLP